MSDFSLTELAALIDDRAKSGGDSSYTRKLLDKGVEKCAQKLGEEAVELSIAAAIRNPDEVKAEAADLLYHLLVLLKVSGVSLQDVLLELQRRTAQSGLEEKAARRHT